MSAIYLGNKEARFNYPDPSGYMAELGYSGGGWFQGLTAIEADKTTPVSAAWHTTSSCVGISVTFIEPHKLEMREMNYLSERSQDGFFDGTIRKLKPFLMSSHWTCPLGLSTGETLPDLTAYPACAVDPDWSFTMEGNDFNHINFTSIWGPSALERRVLPLRPSFWVEKVASTLDASWTPWDIP